MHLIPISEIKVEDRQRKEITPAELLELKRSIAAKGLFHAPLLSIREDGTYLIAGERRLRAMAELHEDGTVFTYDREVVPPFHIPYSTIPELTTADLQEAELEENILRAPLTWMEEAEAKAKIHEMRTAMAVAKGESPPTHLQTAEYIAARRGDESIANGTTSSTAARTEISRSIAVTKHKDLPEVKAAKNLGQAYAAILDRQERQFKALLAEATATSTSTFRAIRGDCREEMKKLPANTYNIIFSDPPYGIDADTAKSDSRHFYKDDKTSAMEVCHAIISEGFRLTTNRAVLFLWCDVDHFTHLREFAAMQGWSPWRTPLVWHKGEQGHAPWGRAGFIRTYELLLFASKGQRELYIPGGSDVLVRRTAAATKRVHAAEKPVDVLEHFLSKAALEGEKVLDPCCGSGPIFEAGNNLRLDVTGIEITEDYYNMSMSRIGDIQSGKIERKAPAGAESESESFDDPDPFSILES